MAQGSKGLSSIPGLGRRLTQGGNLLLVAGTKLNMHKNISNCIA